jgi:hypothetical protein
MDNARSSPSSPQPATPAQPSTDEARARSPKGTTTRTTTGAKSAASASTETPPTPPVEPTAPLRDVPVDWEALEDAFENNAPEVHSYLQLSTGEVIRVVDGVADPQMHARIAGDTNYLRVDPVSSREQYRWMERFIPMVESPELRGRLNQAIDGKGAFRRFKDVLMTHAEERERWFAYRSERLKTFMDAWLTAHNLQAIARPAWVPVPESKEGPPSSEVAPPSVPAAPREKPRRTPEMLRRQLRDLAETLGPRDLDTLCTFAEFLRARRAARNAEEAARPATEGEMEETPVSSAAAPSEEKP